MSGHSKWSTIKRQKAVVDAKKGAIFTKLSNLISMTAREKGGDPEVNFGLRMAIDKARAVNMPKDNIDRAVKRGTGELGGGQIEELIYEGFGPSNSQFIVKALTDNKNRSAANVRHIFSKYGGSLGSVVWNFEQKGIIRILKENYKIKTEDEELELIEAGVEDIEKEEDGISIYTKVGNLQPVKDYFEKKEIPTESADIEYVAKDSIEPLEEDKEKLEKFMEELDDCEDISDYYTNVNI